MVSEAGVPELARHEIPRELLQPLTARYETALSQLEKIVKVRVSSSSALLQNCHHTLQETGAKQDTVWCRGRFLLIMVLVVFKDEGLQTAVRCLGAQFPFPPQEEQKLKAA